MFWQNISSEQRQARIANLLAELTDDDLDAIRAMRPPRGTGLVPVNDPDGKLLNVMLRVGGKSHYCGCGCNVFHHPDALRPELYECNSCGIWLKTESRANSVAT